MTSFSFLRRPISAISGFPERWIIVLRAVYPWGNFPHSHLVGGGQDREPVTLWVSVVRFTETEACRCSTCGCGLCASWHWLFLFYASFAAVFFRRKHRRTRPTDHVMGASPASRIPGSFGGGSADAEIFRSRHEGPSSLRRGRPGAWIHS